MRHLNVLVFLLLAPICLGASCNGSNRTQAANSGSSERPTKNAPPPATRIESLTQVDVSQLVSSEKTMWVDLVNEALSPCGEPVSVATCVAENRRCRTCVPAARYLARLVAEGYDKAEIQNYFNLRFGREPAAQIPVTGSPVRGSSTAAITIVAYSDFQCPHCGAAHPVLRRTMSEFEGNVRFVFKHFPLDGHERAIPAAKAAIAAGKQGKFWEMHDLLFENQMTLEDSDIERFATTLGLDMVRFRADMELPEVERFILANKEEGRRLGVAATPTVFVNGRKFEEPLTALGAYLREELDQ